MRVLLTNVWMNNLGGSELVTLELAEEFIRCGHEVLIYSPAFGGALDCSHVETTHLKPDTKPFDVVWIHHNLLIHDLGFRKWSHQRFIFNHMSSYVNIERPRLGGHEVELADLILANSPETAKAIYVPCNLFQNPAPLAFESVGAGNSGPLMISNHPPPELGDIIGKRIGNGSFERITPELLSRHSCVVANGKTVQYALRAGVPVYLYDHFGGCGWLTEDNFALAEWHNFSGRGFGKKSTASISRELANVPEAMPCPDRFKLEEVLWNYLG